MQCHLPHLQNGFVAIGSRGDRSGFRLPKKLGPLSFQTTYARPGLEVGLKLFFEKCLCWLHPGKLRHPPERDEGAGGEKVSGSLKRPFFLFRVPTSVHRALGRLQLPPRRLGGKHIREVVGHGSFWEQGSNPGAWTICTFCPSFKERETLELNY